MRFEHVAIQVAGPAKMVQWYGEHLGLTVARHVGGPADTHFLADETGRVLVEIYCNAKASLPDYASMHPLLLHLAFVSQDTQADCDRLVKAGATVVDPPFTTPNGDCLAMLRDPWGLALQLCCRSESM
jgi:uncharacterized glyoxalase superfamily protein PhnB